MKYREIETRDGIWFIKGSSEPFESPEEAMKILRQRKPKHLEGRRFYSEKLQMFFRSNWEIEMAEWLEEMDIEWDYEPRRFYFKAHKESYLPDFYLPDFDVWIEVKGYMDKRSERRIKLFKKYESPQFLLVEKLEMELIRREPSLLMALIVASMKE